MTDVERYQFVILNFVRRYKTVPHLRGTGSLGRCTSRTVE
jgi:hypothetical protein